MLDLNSGKIIYLPEEIVNIIADYHDYEKYCKPLIVVLQSNF